MRILPNAIKNIFPGKKGISEKQEILRYCKTAKLFSSIATATSLAQMLWFRNFPATLIGAATLLASHDVFVIADNAETIADNLFKEIAAMASKSYVIQQLSRRTILPIWPSIIKNTFPNLKNKHP